MRAAILLLVSAAAAWAANVVGTLSAVRPERLELIVKSDQGAEVTVALTPETVLRRVAPGQKDLKQAEEVLVTGLELGDRVIATVADDGRTLRRLIVMSAGAIAQKQDADREDWTKRGVLGRVESLQVNSVTLTTRAGQKMTVNVTASTKVRRYLADSIKFADAREAKLSEIKTGDQVRARGSKSEDGLTLGAEELVFGTFVTKAVEVTAIDNGVLRGKDVSNGKAISVKVSADAQIKRMPEMPRLMGGPGPNGQPPGGGMPGGGPGMMMRGGGPPDPAQMIERMPAARFEDFKPGETVIVSSTAGARTDELNAIMVVGNAEMILRMMSRPAAGSGAPAGPGGGLGMGMGGGMMDLSGMMMQ